MTTALLLFRLKKTLRRKANLCRALLTAALHSIASPIDSLAATRKALTLWFHWWDNSIPTEFWVYFRRLRACHRCNLYDHSLQTCGSFKNDPDLGCKCHMPTKAGIPEADCWIRENDAYDGENGWPDHLRHPDNRV